MLAALARRGAALRVHSVERSIVLGAMSSSLREMLFEHGGLAARAIGRAFLSALPVSACF